MRVSLGRSSCYARLNDGCAGRPVLASAYRPRARRPCLCGQSRTMVVRLLVLPRTALLALMLAGCAGPDVQTWATSEQPPRLASEQAVMNDGYRLPLRHWGSPKSAHAVVLALHGFNDYRNAFAELGPYLADREVITYAYDQRGFGATAERGHWAGSGRMIADLRNVASLLRQRYPHLPLYLLGESMGGAVVMAAGGTGATGVILVAPAVWSRDTMNPVERFALWAASHTAPWLKVSGRGLHIWPSDNRNMLRAFSADPLVIKETRIDALWGVTNLMDRAAAAAGGVRPPALILYGEHDEIIPKRAFCAMVHSLPRNAPGLRLVLYAHGWHMLTRDLQGARVRADIAAWLDDTSAALPSGEETARGGSRLARLCRGQAPSGVAARPPVALN